MDNQTIVDDVMKTLNLDDVADTRHTIETNLKAARAILVNAINSKVADDVYNKDELFIAALEALTAQLFYDRTLENNMDLGIQMMIVQLQAKYADYEAGETNGNAENN